MGTGKRLSLGFNNSSSNTLYRLGYTNPYYTIDGISRGFNLSYRKTDFAELNSLDYITNVGNASMNFGLPISDTGRVGLDLAMWIRSFAPALRRLRKSSSACTGPVLVTSEEQ